MIVLDVEPATADAVRPFGCLIGAVPDAVQTMAFGAARIFGAIPFVLEGTPELLVCSLGPREMRCTLMERHFRHTQVYMPMDGKPFIMVLGPDTPGELPVPETLRAFRFENACGISIKPGIWHEFPFALEPDTRFSIVLVKECHISTSTTPEQPGDADGPDLQRRVFAGRPGLQVSIATAG